MIIFIHYNPIGNCFVAFVVFSYSYFKFTMCMYNLDLQLLRSRYIVWHVLKRIQGVRCPRALCAKWSIPWRVKRVNLEDESAAGCWVKSSNLHSHTTTSTCAWCHVHSLRSGEITILYEYSYTPYIKCCIDRVLILMLCNLVFYISLIIY